MAGSEEPRTLLEALVREQHLSWEEAATLVVKTARKHEGVSISLSGRHLGRLARNERSGTGPILLHAGPFSTLSTGQLMNY
jgi:hypothetical protein